MKQLLNENVVSLNFKGTKGITFTTSGLDKYELYSEDATVSFYGSEHTLLGSEIEDVEVLIQGHVKTGKFTQFYTLFTNKGSVKIHIESKDILELNVQLSR